MGYNGMGMRKENYKRKPRSAFEKVKALLPPTTRKSVVSNMRGTDELRKVNKKPLYKTKYFWYPLVSVVIALSITIDLNVNSFSNSVFFGWLVPDEKENFTDLKEFYKEHKTSIDSVLQFVKTREGKLSGIRFDADSLTLKIRSENYETVKGNQSALLRHRNSTDFHSKEEPEIIEGALKVDTYGYHRLYTDFWSYDLKVAQLRDINTTFISHLETSYTELHAILTIVAKEHFKVKLNNGHPAIAFRHDSRNYEIIANDTVDFSHSSHTILGSGVYAIRKSRFSNLGEE